MDRVEKRTLLNKTMVLVFGVFLLSQTGFDEGMVIFVLISFSISLFSLLLKRPQLSILSVFMLLLLSSWWPEYGYFIPVIVYDTMFDVTFFSPLFSGGMLLLFFLMNAEYDPVTKYFLLFLSFFSGYLSFLTLQEQALGKKYNELKVTSLEKIFSLENKNKDLVEAGETKISLEIAAEQNRIARDIHDHVGHLLSSSLLQVGAIRTINTDDQLMPLLEQLQGTMNEGLNNIRESVHNLHEESISLSDALAKMLQHFTFCEVKVTGALAENISKEYKIAYLMLLKEALANVMKHSNATKVSIDFQTYPGFYKMTIADNGTFNAEKPIGLPGMGLIGMKERIEKLAGRVNYYQENTGFSIRAILPRKRD